MPVTIDYPFRSSHLSPVDEANIVTALKHTRRVRCIEIFASPSFLRKVATIMRKSIPALTHLELTSDWDFVTGTGSLILPKGFLNGSAPCLQYLSLGMFLIPEVPTFLLSSHNLITLELETRFQNNSISPEAMVECLSGMTRLKTLSISFYYNVRFTTVAIGQEMTRSDLTTRVILPSLTHFDYAGHSEYSEDLMAQIDAPLLIKLGMTYYGIHQASQIQASQLSRFIGHIENFDQPSRAKATFRDGVTVELDYLHRKGLHASLSIFLPVFDHLGQQILDTADFLGELFTTFSNVNHLSANGALIFAIDNDLVSSEWLPFFRLFPAVGVLQLSGVVGADIIASSLEGTTEEMVAEVLPALHTIWLDNKDHDKEPLEEGSMKLQQFLSLRKSSGHPVTIVNTQEELEEKLEKLESHRNGQENVL